MSENMHDTVARAEKLVDSITGAILSTLETAAQRIDLASQVAQARQRAEALAVVLEGASAQRMSLEARRDAAVGPMRLLLDAQVKAAQAAEVAILMRAGLSQEDAQAVFAPALPAPTEAAPAETEEPKPTHKREGRRFVPVNGSN